MWKIFAAAVLTIGLVGCETLRDHQMERSVARSRAAALAKIDPEECRAKVGAIQQLGTFGITTCVEPRKDADKACCSNSEGAGVCLPPDGVPIGQAATGTGQVDTAAMLGCHDHVEGGVVVGGFCVD